MELTEKIKNLHEQLKGTRSKNGVFTIADFVQEDYDELFQVLTEELAPIFEGDYYAWYRKQVRSFLRFKKAQSKTFDFHVAQMDDIEYHTVQVQLTVLKYFLYRFTHSTHRQKRWSE